MDDIDRKIIKLVQGDLPLEIRPFDAWADELGIAPEVFVSRLALLRRGGVVRSVKAVLRHRRAGFSSGAMVVWAVPEERVEDVGRMMASRKEISHCYERPGFGGHNLFSMIHGRTEDDVIRVVDEVASSLGLHEYRIYWSGRELKKSSMNYDRRNSGEER
ncbi:MAG TPA: Lrp/AsnC family transcriptional regulator [Deltaproteobacteria bacterium]|nr:Lrp/AsnC family transcriptional regulator [Deltaproteobacteria bacterium]